MVLRGDLGIDPATGLPNLFGLLEAAHTGTLGTTGAVFAADIVELSIINATYGKKAGDACVRGLAGLLRAIAHSDEVRQHAAPLAPIAFRIGGDEFVLVMPGATKKDAEAVASHINDQYQKRMQGHGVPETSLHTAVLDYDQRTQSTSAVLKVAYLALEGCRLGVEMPSTLPPWAEALIDNMADRTCDTLALLREARTLALTDEISGLPNHRAAELYLEDMLHEYVSNGEICSMLLVDGDNLKGYNELGYQRGNQMIRDLSGIVSQSVRYGDRVARWLSGDEFLVLLPGADKKAAIMVAERLRAAVESGTATWPLPVTVSIGVASCPDDGVMPSQLLARLEERNAAAKRAGKNQVS